MSFLQFLDRLIPYERFLKDIGATVVEMLKSDWNDPEFVSQRQAWKIFGRRNVERWKKQGKIMPCKRPGRVEYRMAELRYLQRTEDDYYKD